MSSESSAVKTRIRILHHMARTGGTVICRCLASMNNLVLLSEIHPDGMKVFNPLRQAHAWYGLLGADDLGRARRGEIGFVEAIRLIARRAREEGRILLLRDWSHLDYIGIPYSSPTFRSALADTLKPEFELLRFSTVRHPRDQWLSLSQDAIYRKQLGTVKFLRGARRFAEAAVGTGFIRYEDFTREPDAALRTICSALELEFDPGYQSRWMHHVNITGDILPGRASSVIAPLPRQAMDPKEERRFVAQANYAETTALLGYPPESRGATPDAANANV